MLYCSGFSIVFKTLFTNCSFSRNRFYKLFAIITPGDTAVSVNSDIMDFNTQLSFLPY